MNAIREFIRQINQLDGREQFWALLALNVTGVVFAVAMVISWVLRLL